VQGRLEEQAAYRLEQTGISFAHAAVKTMHQIWLRLIPGITLVVTLVAVWLPELSHYRVSSRRVDAQIVQASRSAPDGATLARLASIRLSSDMVLPREQWIAAAEDVLTGSVPTNLFGVVDNTFPFGAEDLTLGSSTEQLYRASMTPASVLLDAYEQTRDARYLAGAAQMVAAWARFESSAWLPRGLVWNDHAIAERALVLTRFWSAYRRSGAYDPAVGELALRFARRSADLLAKPDHFTARTNHGFMQSIALLQLGGAFPSLPRSAEYRHIAQERIERQLEYYLSPEGVILEHSAGYQNFGVQLLDAFEVLAETLKIDVPAALEARTQASRRVLANLARPDGSLPMYGNTAAHPTTSLAQMSAAEGQDAIYPISGLAAFWAPSVDARYLGPVQSVAVWANFATRAHKHADEASIILWAGQPLVTGVGYWPYDDHRHNQARSWRASNAPHLMNERRESTRKTELQASAATELLAFLDLARTGPNEIRVGRQLAWVRPDLWVIIDDSPTAGKDNPLQTVWTLYPGVRTRRLREGVYAAQSSSGEDIACFAEGGRSTQVAKLIANDEPFGGFVSLDAGYYGIRPTESLEMTASAGQPLVSILSLAGTADCSQLRVASFDWRHRERWTAVVEYGARTSRIERNDGAVFLTSGAGERKETHLQRWSAEPQRTARTEIDGAFQRMQEDYPQVKNLLPWRKRASMALLATFGAQETLLAGCAWFARTSRRVRRLRDALIAFLAVSWAAASIWLLFFYLV
jgi:Heparinase II/III N-terminus/Heparinase II/III-like protein